MKCQREGCTASFTHAEADNHYYNTCSKLKLKCPNGGCSYETTKDEQETFDEHVSECRYSAKTCTVCGVSYTVREAFYHHSSVCLKREVKCEECGVKHSFDETEAHANLCTVQTVKCKKGVQCKWSGAREELETHECGYDKGKFCPIKGCKKHMYRFEIKKHLQNEKEKRKHLDLCKKFCSSLQIKVSESNTKIQEWREKNWKFKETLKEMKKTAKIVQEGFRASTPSTPEPMEEEEDGTNGGEGRSIDLSGS